MAGTAKGRASLLSNFFGKVGSVFTNSSGDDVVGLSIGSSSIKCVELKRIKKQWKLQKAEINHNEHFILKWQN